LIPLRDGSSPARLRLYCLPYAGGSAGLFRPWRNFLPPDIALCGVEYPGRGTRISESPLDRIDELAGQVADGLARAPPGPYALFGHSMGSLVAFETSHQLAARGAPLPILLVASGHGAASLPFAAEPVHASPDREFLARLRELNATPPEALEMPDFLELMLPILRADFRASETYVPPNRPKLKIPIAAYGGLADVDVSRDQLLAWADETTAGCIVRMFPGDHFFLSTARERVVAMLTGDLVHALAASTPNSALRAAGEPHPR
jgi:surfactin synthase thioesterase subunit